MKRSRRVLSLIVVLLALAAPPPSGAQAPAAGSRIADVRVRSTPETTEILVSVPPDLAFEDRSKVRPGKVVVDEVRLFFPGERLTRARLVTVGDVIVEEARLFPEGDGVVMTVVVRRPVTYQVRREGNVLRLSFQPGALLAEGAPPVVEERKKREARVQPAIPSGRRPGERRDSGPRGDLAAPKIEVPELRAGEGLSVDAEQLTYDREANQVIARGRVTIARAGSLLTADEVRIDRETKVAEAIGDVQLSDPQGTIRAERFRLNLDDETGELVGGDVFLNQTRASIRGEKFEKSYGQTYHIENGTFTTCDCGVGAPSWSIAGDEIDVTLDGYGIVDGATFRVLDVPVFYLPKAAFPAKVSRQSGLLAPQLGYSKKRGATYLQPLYVVLNKSADVTLSVDVETEARIGGIAEYRYAAGTRSRGSLNGAFFDEFLRTNAERDIVNQNVADPDIPDQRWSATADVSQELPFEITGFADVLAVSDDFFLREIPTFSFDPQFERQLRTSRYTSSRGGFYRLWDHATVMAQAIYYQDFVQEDDLTLQRLPQVSAWASQRFFDRHLKLRFAGEGVNFERDEGFDGPRLDVFPTAEIPFRWSDYLRGGVYGGFRETAYHLNNKDLLLPESEEGGVEEDPTAADLQDNPTRELWVTGATIGSEVYRVFEVGGKTVEKLKHTIEPAVDYVYIPDVEQDDLPFYDFTDRITQRNLFTYGFTTRLLAKLTRAPSLETTPLSPGELNSFTGVSPAPFGDERTRETFGGGYGPLDPALEEELPGLEEPYEEETPAELEAPLPGEETLTREERAERRRLRRAGRRAARDEEGVSRVVEWANLRIMQSYDLDETLQPDRTDHFSDVDVRLRVNPASSLALFSESSIDARESELTATRVGVMLRDPRRRRPGVFLQSGQPAALGVSYRFIENDALEEVDGGLILPLADSLSAFYQSRYDAVAGEFLENRWGFRLLSQCRCWILDMSVADRINPNETEVRAQVTLVGLGSIGRSR